MINLPNRSALNNNIAKWDLDELDPKDFIDSFKRIIKPTGNIFIFTSYNMIGKWHEAFDKEFDTFQYLYGIKLIHHQRYIYRMDF